MKRKKPKHESVPLRVDELMCRRCRVQPTLNKDHICGICQAIGQSVEPEPVSRRAFLLTAKPFKPLILWLENHRFFGLRESEV